MNLDCGCRLGRVPGYACKNSLGSKTRWRKSAGVSWRKDKMRIIRIIEKADGESNLPLSASRWAADLGAASTRIEACIRALTLPNGSAKNVLSKDDYRERHAKIAVQTNRFEGNDLRGNPCIGVLFALVLGGCAGSDKNEIALVNPGFEAPMQDNGTIPGWSTAQHAGPISYEMTIDKKVKAEGAASFRITRKREQVYGSVSQRVPAAHLAGKTVELSAMLKTEGVGEKGWTLRLRPLDVEGDTVTAGTLTGTTEFTRVAARLRVPPDTRELQIFATLRDSGSAWLDDVHLRIVEP